MAMAWIIIAWFTLCIIGIQARVGVKPSGVPTTQGLANAVTIIYLVLIVGVVLAWL